MLLTILAGVAGLYLLIGIIGMSWEWQEFRNTVFATERDPNHTLPPPWACWLMGIFLWIPAMIASVFDKDRPE